MRSCANCVGRRTGICARSPHRTRARVSRPPTHMRRGGPAAWRRRQARESSRRRGWRGCRRRSRVRPGRSGRCARGPTTLSTAVARGVASGYGFEAAATRSSARHARSRSRPPPAASRAHAAQPHARAPSARSEPDAAAGLHASRDSRARGARRGRRDVLRHGDLAGRRRWPDRRRGRNLADRLALSGRRRGRPHARCRGASATVLRAPRPLAGAVSTATSG